MKELIDKVAVRDDYVRGFSVRMLAAKYGVPRSTISDWVRRYGWEQQGKIRAIKELKEKPDTSDIPDTDVADISDSRQVSEPLMVDGDYAQIRDYAYKVMQKADQLLELDDALAPRDLKSLSGMLLDIRNLLNIQSPREAAEQELRLRALAKQCEDKSTSDTTVNVVFVDTEGAEE